MRFSRILSRSLAMKSEQPDISIITVVFNGENTLLPTIKSVECQTHRNYEYLIIDGKSSDGTVALIQKRESVISNWISEPDRGVYDAMNKGLELAKGKYVLFLNAGDELASPTVLESIFSQKIDADIWYGETIILNPNREPIGTRTSLTSRKLPLQLTKADFLQGQVVSHQSFIAKRSLCAPYDLKYSCSADIEWMLHAIEQSSVIMNLGQPISRYLQGGISDRKLITCWKERFLILTRHFAIYRVVWQHIGFAFRFLRFGAYRKDS